MQLLYNLTEFNVIQLSDELTNQRLLTNCGVLSILTNHQKIQLS